MLVGLHVDAVDEPHEEFDVVSRSPVAVVFPRQLSGGVNSSRVSVVHCLFALRLSLDLLAVLVSDPVAGHGRLLTELAVFFDPIHIT